MSIDSKATHTPETIIINAGTNDTYAKIIAGDTEITKLKVGDIFNVFPNAGAPYHLNTCTTDRINLLINGNSESNNLIINKNISNN
jgi:hypothetical protein